MWAIDRTENNLRYHQSVIKDERERGLDGRFKADILSCLVQIARNLADISDSLSEMNGYNLSDREKFMTPKDFEQRMSELVNDPDREQRHMVADGIMCDLLRNLGYGDGVQAFEGMDKYYI